MPTSRAPPDSTTRKAPTVIREGPAEVETSSIVARDPCIEATQPTMTSVSAAGAVV